MSLIGSSCMSQCPNTGLRKSSSAVVWCAHCYANVRCRGSYRGHLGYRVPSPVRFSWRPAMSFLSKPASKEDQARLGGTPDGGTFMEAYPALWEYLAYGVWPDGSPRETATLLVMYQDGLLKACLGDKATERVFWASSDDWYALLDGMNRALVDGTATWRRKPPWAPPARKK